MPGKAVAPKVAILGYSTSSILSIEEKPIGDLFLLHALSTATAAVSRM